MNLTANQIYLKSGCNRSFANWMEDQKNDYNKRVNNGKINPQTPFLRWLNLKWEAKMNYAERQEQNADGFGKTLLGNFLEGVGEALLGKSENSDTSTDNTLNNQPKPVKTILGLKPSAFFAISGVAALGIITAVIIYKKKN